MAMSNAYKQDQVVKEEIVQEEDFKKTVVKEEKNTMKAVGAIAQKIKPNVAVEPKEEVEEKKAVMADHGHREYEHISWTRDGQLKLQCVDGCDSVLANNVYGQLAKTVHPIE